MQQHPVPQNIASYQFRLIGDMTLKQFLELAGGIILAIIFYHSRFLSYFKWPLLVISALSGAGLAFLPFQERPLDVWIKNFFKSIYAPTQYIWKKKEKVPDLFEESKAVVSKLPLEKPTAKDKAILEEYLQSLPRQPAPTKIDQQETKKLEKINSLFTTLGPGLPIVSTPSVKEEISLRPSIKIKVRKLKPPSARLPQFKPTITPVKIPAKPAVVSKPQPKPVIQKPQLKTDLPLAESKPIIEAAPPLTPPLSIKAIPIKKPKLPRKTVAASFSVKLPMPSMPDVPNIVAGMILTNDNKILPNTLIEIKNRSGATVRALKSNKLGQFSISSPLENGKYTLTAENDAYHFDIIELVTEGKIISPIKIKAKNRKQETMNNDQSKQIINQTRQTIH